MSLKMRPARLPPLIFNYLHKESLGWTDKETRFAIFNDGVDKILEAMEPCRDSLRQWKDQKQRIEDEIDKSNQHWDKKISQIEDENKQKEDENTDLKKKFENDSKQREQEAETEKGN